MRKFTLVLELFLLLSTTANASEVTDKQVNTKANEIISVCKVNITDEYVPDMVLQQQYADGIVCLEKQIKEIAKNIFDEDNYQKFCASLAATSFSYSQITHLLNEKSKGIDGLPGTFEQMQTYSQQYNFLFQLLETMVNYRT